MKNLKKAYLYIGITALLFSSMEVVLKFVAGGFHPIQLTFTRFFFGCMVLFPFAHRALKKQDKKLSYRDLAHFAFLGFIGIFVSMICYQISVAYTKASVVAILFSSNPIFIAVFAYLILKEPITKRQLVTLALDILGIIVIVNPFSGNFKNIGVIFVIISALLFALYSVLGRSKVKEYGSFVVTCYSFLFGSLEMMAVAALGHIPAVAKWMTDAGLGVFANVPFTQGYSLANLPILLYIFIGVTGVGYACYFLAMENSSTATASLVFFIKPALAPLLAFLILGETVPFTVLVGIALILLGSFISTRPASTKPSTAKSIPLSGTPSLKGKVS